ncbi:hypothetical protein [Flagellimonas myxillae]|uniref:hypothetical protein n=1 Tax=Flagellimonas myxillae TaxID=2942214 RepID=UPI00201F7795|nr:hypothetical protein [Muricauda myxillae]MCL6266638.1 hypothetical protein [Muricauda myxillae]
MFKYIHYVLLITCAVFVCSIQDLHSQNSGPDSFNFQKNGISKPHALATHPFGILFGTLPHNFKRSPSSSKQFDFQVDSGNIWGQPVTVLVPTSSNDRERMKEILFYSRTYNFDAAISPHQTYSFQYDGVVKNFRLAFSLPIQERNEITISSRAFLLTKGTFPFSILTGDQFIEFFHSNIAGGEDPFGRRIRGLDNASIRYTDRNGQSMNIGSGSFVFSGIDLAYYHYPTWFNQKNISLNFGTHLGVNLSPYNSSMDLGISAAGIKVLNPKGKGKWQLGLGINLLRRGFIQFNKNQIDLGTSSYYGSFDGHFEYARKNKKGAYHSIGLGYRIQTPYNNKKEEDYYVPDVPERIARWHEAARHLYKFPSYWSLIYSFTKKTELSIYLQQDMLVNNTPDIQTGVRLRVPISL